jgi:hypothetical protein
MALGDYTPLHYALRRPLIPLAERLMPLTDLSKRATDYINSFLQAALDPLRSHQRIDSLNFLLQHASSHLQEGDIVRCIPDGGLRALDAVLLAPPPVMLPSPSAWLHDHAIGISMAILLRPKLYRWSSSETISILDRVWCQYDLSPSDLVLEICEHEDPEVLKWAIDKGARLTVYSKEQLAEMIRHLPIDWRHMVLQVWDSQNSGGAS